MSDSQPRSADYLAAVQKRNQLEREIREGVACQHTLSKLWMFVATDIDNASKALANMRDQRDRLAAALLARGVTEPEVRFLASGFVRAAEPEETP